MQTLRLVPHDALTKGTMSPRQTLVRKKPGLEIQPTIQAVGCRHGKCTFCGLGKIDEAHKKPLSKKEFISQLEWAKNHLEGAAPEGISKVSIINNAHSTIENDVISRDALNAGLNHIFENFPSLRQLSLETRVNLIAKSDISRLTRAAGYPPLDFMEVAVGVESGDERIRNREMKKGLSDLRIYEAAHILSDYGWAMRAYFIYNCPGRPFEERTHDFLRMAEFLSEVKSRTGVSLTLYANRGYIPEGMEKRFPDFRIADERETIVDLMIAASACKKGGITLDVDVTGSDEAQTNAAALEIKSGFATAVGGFNTSQETAGLLDWLRRA